MIFLHFCAPADGKPHRLRLFFAALAACLLMFVFAGRVPADPALTLSKSLSGSGDGKPEKSPVEKSPGDTVGFEIKIQNTGDAPAFGILLVDKLPEGMDDAGVSALVSLTVQGADGSAVDISPIPVPHVSETTYDEDNLWTTNRALTASGIKTATVPQAGPQTERTPRNIPTPDGIFRIATWDFGDLALNPGETLHLVYQATVDRNASPGWVLKNTAYVRDYFARPLSENPGQIAFGPSNKDTEIVVLPLPGGIVQSLDAEVALIGDVVTYTIELPVDRPGRPDRAPTPTLVRFHDLEVSDSLPLGMRLISTEAVSVAANGVETPMAHTYIGNPGKMTFEDLLAGHSLKLKIKAMVVSHQTDFPGETTVYNNYASYTYATEEGGEKQDGGAGNSPLLTLLEPSPNLLDAAVSLTGASGSVVAADEAERGDTVDYQVTFVNAGNVPGYGTALFAKADPALKNGVLTSLMIDDRVFVFPEVQAGTRVSETADANLWRWDIAALAKPATGPAHAWRGGETLKATIRYRIDPLGTVVPGQQLNNSIYVSMKPRNTDIVLPDPDISDPDTPGPDTPVSGTSGSQTPGSGFVIPDGIKTSPATTSAQSGIRMAYPSLQSALVPGQPASITPGQTVTIQIDVSVPNAVHKGFSVTDFLAPGWTLTGMDLVNVVGVTTRGGDPLGLNHIIAAADTLTGELLFQFGTIEGAGAEPAAGTGGKAGFSLRIDVKPDADLTIGTVVKNFAALQFDDKYGNPVLRQEDPTQAGSGFSLEIVDFPLSSGLAVTADPSRVKQGDRVTYGLRLPLSETGGQGLAASDLLDLSLVTNLPDGLKVFETKAFLADADGTQTAFAAARNPEPGVYGFNTVPKGKSLYFQVTADVTAPPADGPVNLYRGDASYSYTTRTGGKRYDGGSAQLPELTYLKARPELISLKLTDANGGAPDAAERGDLIRLAATFRNTGDIDLTKTALNLELSPGFGGPNIESAALNGRTLDPTEISLSGPETTDTGLNKYRFRMPPDADAAAWPAGREFKAVVTLPVSKTQRLFAGQALKVVAYASAGLLTDGTDNETEVQSAKDETATAVVTLAMPVVTSGLIGGEPRAVAPGQPVGLRVRVSLPDVALDRFNILSVLPPEWLVESAVLSAVTGIEDSAGGRALPLGAVPVNRDPQSGHVSVGLGDLNVTGPDGALDLDIRVYPGPDAQNDSVLRATFGASFVAGYGSGGDGNGGDGTVVQVDGVVDPDDPDSGVPPILVSTAVPALTLSAELSAATPGPHVAAGVIRIDGEIENTGVTAVYDPVVEVMLAPGLSGLSVPPVFSAAAGEGVGTQSYNPDTGILTWTAPAGTKIPAGTPYRFSYTLGLDDDLKAAHRFSVETKLSKTHSLPANTPNPDLIVGYPGGAVSDTGFSTARVQPGIYKRVDKTQIIPGDILTYVLTLPASGDGQAAPLGLSLEQLGVRDVLPDGLKLQSLVAETKNQSGNGAGAYQTTAYQNNSTDRELNISLPVLAAGETAKITLTAEVLNTDAMRLGAVLKNTATAAYAAGAGVQAVAASVSNAVETEVLSCRTAADCMEIQLSAGEGQRDATTGLTVFGFKLLAKNTGLLDLTGVEIKHAFVEQLTGQGANRVSLVPDSLTAELKANPDGRSQFALNPDFAASALNDGVLTGAGSRLTPGAVLHIAYQVRMDPGTARNLSGSASFSAVLPDGRTLTTASVPETGAAVAPTPLVLPSAGIAKRLEHLEKIGGGYFRADYILTVVNDGTAALTGIRIKDPLIGHFVADGVTAGSIRIVDGPKIQKYPAAPDSNLYMTPNIPGFTGETGNGGGSGDDLIDVSQASSMSGGDKIELSYSVHFLMAQLGDVSNTASLSAVTAGGSVISDQSVDGSIPDADGDGNPGNDTGETTFTVKPTGIVYNSTTRQPVAGAVIRVKSVDGMLLPEGCLAPGQQNQVTGANGAYRVDIAVGTHSSCPKIQSLYRLDVTPPSPYISPSLLIPPNSTALDATGCQGDQNLCFVAAAIDPGAYGSADLESAVAALPYHLDLSVAAGDPDVVHNHIALDAGAEAGAVTITKTAGKSRISKGDLIPYALVIKNVSATPLSELKIVDTPPAGFRFVENSAFLENGTGRVQMAPNFESGAMVWNISQTQSGEPAKMLTAGASLTVSYLLAAGAGTDVGTYENTAVVQRSSDGLRVSNTAVATVTVGPDAVLDCPELVGKVYEDQNRNGRQDAGEQGLGNVRLATVDGRLVTTDRHGRYHLACPAIPRDGIGSNFILKLDRATLPKGYRTRNGASKVVRLTRGKAAALNFAVAPARDTGTVENDGEAPGEALEKSGEPAEMNGEDGLFMVGLADLTIGRSLIKRADASTASVLYADGRAAFYLKGKIRGDVLLTAMADYQASGEGADFSKLLANLSSSDPRALLANPDPDKYYPVYGDQSSVTDDTPTKERFYIRVEKDASYALVGDFSTDLNGFRFVRVNRRLTGAKGAFRSREKTGFGAERTRVTAYAAAPDHIHTTDILRGTGGSLYYLQQRGVIAGTHTLSVEVRDVRTDLLLARQTLKPGADYQLDTASGRVLLTRPLASTVSGETVFSQGGLRGHKVYLIASYDYAADKSSADVLNRLNAGGQASAWLNDRLQVGISGTNSVDKGNSQSTVAGQATLRLSEETKARIEIAQSQGSRQTTNLSNDGGFKFTSIPPVTSPGPSYGVAVDLQTGVPGIVTGAVGGEGVLKGKAKAYVRRYGDGFTAMGAPEPVTGGTAAGNTVTGGTVSVETLKWGGELETQINERINTVVSYDASRAEKSDGNTGSVSRIAAAVEMQASERTDLSLGLAREITQQSGITATAAATLNKTRIAGRVDYNLDRSKGTRLYGFLNAGLAGGAGRNEYRYGIGARLAPAERFLLGGELSHGSSGDAGPFATGSSATGPFATGGSTDGFHAKVDGSYNWSDLGSVYSSYGISQSGEGNLVFGAKRRLGENLNLFGEERLAHQGMLATAKTTAVGLDYQARPGLRFRFSGEAGSVADDERRAIAGGVSFTQTGLSASSGVEYRVDTDAAGLDRRSYLAHVKGELALPGGFSLGGSARVAGSKKPPDTSPSGASADFSETSIGLAYRPVGDSRFNALARYTYLRDLGPARASSGTKAIDRFQQRAHLFSVDASYGLTPWLTVGGKYGLKTGEQTLALSEQDANSPWFRNRVQLAVLRGDFHVYSRWDVLLEGRMLRMDQNRDGQMRYGGLAGVYRSLGENARVGVGYNFSKFSDNLAGFNQNRPDQDRRGAFINVLGTF